MIKNSVLELQCTLAEDTDTAQILHTDNSVMEYEKVSLYDGERCIIKKQQK